MKKISILLLFCLVATSAFAVVDPAPNSIGIYFDLSGDNNWGLYPPDVPFFVYLVLTNPSAPSIGGYEVGYQNVVQPGMEGFVFRLTSNIANGAVDGLDVGNSSDVFAGDYIVDLNTPLVATPATVLHSWQFILLSPGVIVKMYIGNCSQPSLPGPFPVILNAETETQFTAVQSSGGPDIPVATINDPAHPTGDEDTLFGSVKALFR